MKLTEISFEGQPPVDSYGPGFFRVDEKLHEGHLIILPDSIGVWGGYGDLAGLIAAKDSYDVVFIGTGAEIAVLPADVRAALETADVPFEAMATPPACRTYNVLLSEDRRVALAVLAVTS